MKFPAYGMYLPTRLEPERKLADWGMLILWSEIFPGSRVTKADLVAQVQRIGINRGLRLITAINSISLVHGELADGTQMGLAMEFTKNLPLVRDPIISAVQRGRVLFAAEPLTILASFVVQHGAKEEPDPAHVMDAFMNTILILNELYGCEQLEIQKGSGQGLESFLPVELRAAALDDEPADHLIGRLHAFVKWARLQPVDSNLYCDIDRAFTDIFGWSYENVSAAGLIVRHYFRSINSIPQLKTLDPIVDVEFLVAPLTLQTPIRDFIRSHSMPIDDLAGILAKRDRMTAAALLPLQKHPLIGLGNGRFACPSLTFLSASLGIGLFHRLAEHFGTQGRRPAFHHFFARFLQEYLEKIVSLSVQKRDARIVPEFGYKVGKNPRRSSDLILVEGRTAIFFDVCNKRLNTELSLNAANLKSMHDDIDDMVLDQAKQIDGRINDFRAGAYAIQDLTGAEIDAIIPVAVTHQSIHGWAATRRYIDRRLQELNYLQSGPRLEIISVAEVESLVQAFDGDLSYTGLLTARGSHPDEVARGRSLKNYLLLNGGWDGKARCNMPDYVEWFASVAIPKLASWGFS